MKLKVDLRKWLFMLEVPGAGTATQITTIVAIAVVAGGAVYLAFV